MEKLENQVPLQNLKEVVPAKVPRNQVMQSQHRVTQNPLKMMQSQHRVTQNPHQNQVTQSQ